MIGQWGVSTGLKSIQVKQSMQLWRLFCIVALLRFTSHFRQIDQTVNENAKWIPCSVKHKMELSWGSLITVNMANQGLTAHMQLTLTGSIFQRKSTARGLLKIKSLLTNEKGGTFEVSYSLDCTSVYNYRRKNQTVEFSIEKKLTAKDKIIGPHKCIRNQVSTSFITVSNLNG